MLTERFEAAFVFAARAHATQTRKGTRTPYVSHLMAVASLVLEHGGDEDEAIAALLHDVIEDQSVTAADLRARFGDTVAAIVEGCSDTDVQPKPPWEARKKAYVAHLAEAPVGVMLVSCADKLHNARSLVLDLRTHGATVWSRFNATGAQTLWYYRAVLAAFTARRAEFDARGAGALVDELARTVDALAREPAG